MSETTASPTNRKYAETSTMFITYCENASKFLSEKTGEEIVIKSTARQASKFRRGFGAAYQFGK